MRVMLKWNIRKVNGEECVRFYFEVMVLLF